MNTQYVSDLVRPQNVRLSIGFLTEDLGVPGEYMAVVASGVIAAAKTHAVNLFCVPGGALSRLPEHDEFVRQRNILYKLMTRECVDGLIIMGSVGTHGTMEELINFHRAYHSHALPTVSIGTPLKAIPSIIVDNEQGLRDAITHLIEVHHYPRIAFIRGPEEVPEAQMRYRVYTEVLAAHEIALDPALVAPGTFQLPSGSTAIRLLLDQRHVTFEAVVAANDMMALGAMEELQRRNILVPYEIAVVGFDDVEAGRLALPSLTTVRQPMAKLGSQALDVLLAKIRGEMVSELVTLPTEMIVRQSCGCYDPMVKQIIVQSPTITKNTGEPLTAQREVIASNLEQTIGTAAGLPSGWAAPLVDSMITDLTRVTSDTFLVALDRLLRQTVMMGSDVTIWQRVISTLRQVMFPRFDHDEAVWRAESLWHQARLFIEEVMHKVQAQQYAQQERQNTVFRAISQMLVTTIHVGGLMDVIARELPRLGVERCYLALYKEPQTADGIFELSRLMLAYDEARPDGQKRLAIESGGQYFRTHALAPEGILPLNRYTMVIEPLYFQNQQLGFVSFDMSLHDGTVYDELRGQISSALYAALLVQQVQEHAQELSVAYDEIRILNEQLKDENLQMHTEMDLARRIQTALLPQSVKHLHPDFEIAAIMLPAEDVGGDYYDITLDLDGTLWFGIGDVSGHGVTPGLIMMMAQTVHTTITSNLQANARDIVIMINTVLYKNVKGRLREDHFMTFTTLKYLGEGRFQHAGAHLDLAIYRQHQQTCELIDTPGTWLNFIPDVTDATTNEEFALEIGDVLVLYTDGLTEAFNRENKILDIQRFMEIIRRHGEQDVETMRDAILQDVLDWCENDRRDDMSLVVVRRMR